MISCKYLFLVITKPNLNSLAYKLQAIYFKLNSIWHEIISFKSMAGEDWEIWNEMQISILNYWDYFLIYRCKSAPNVLTNFRQ